MVRHFIDIADFKKNELENIINFARKIKTNPNKFSKLLQNKSLGIIFEKQSKTEIVISTAVNKRRLSSCKSRLYVSGNPLTISCNAIN